MLKESQAQLAESEEKKKRCQEGLPNTETEKADRIVAEEIIIEPLDDQAEKRLREKIDLIKLIAETSRTNMANNQIIQVYGKKVESLANTLQTVAIELRSLNNQLQPVLVDMQRRSKKEEEMLDKLNDYLEKWV